MGEINLMTICGDLNDDLDDFFVSRTPSRPKNARNFDFQSFLKFLQLNHRELILGSERQRLFVNLNRNKILIDFGMKYGRIMLFCAPKSFKTFKIVSKSKI